MNWVVDLLYWKRKAGYGIYVRIQINFDRLSESHRPSCLLNNTVSYLYVTLSKRFPIKPLCFSSWKVESFTIQALTMHRTKTGFEKARSSSNGRPKR